MNGNPTGAGNASLTFTGGPVTLAGNIATTNQNVTFNSAVTLSTAARSVTAGTGTINFASTINGAQALTINATGGAVTLGGVIGGTTPIGALTVTGNTTLSANVTTNNAAIVFNSPLTLGANLTINSTGGNITFGSTFNGFYNLTTNSGAGTTTFSGVVGGVTPIRLLNVTGPTTLSANITSIGATFNSAVTLSGNVTLNVGTGYISFASTVDASTYNLSTVSSDITLGGDLTSTGGALTLSSAGGSVMSVGNTNQDYNLSATEIGYIQSGFSSVTINADGGMGVYALTWNNFPLTLIGPVININGAQTLSNNLTLQTDALAILANLTGSSQLVIKPNSVGTTIGLGGGTGGLNLTDAELDYIGAGSWSGITIGPF